MKKEIIKKSIVNIIDKKLIAADPRQAFEEHYNNLLKTKQGLSYLCMKYPNLSVNSAINEYFAEAWIVEACNLT